MLRDKVSHARNLTIRYPRKAKFHYNRSASSLQSQLIDRFISVARNKKITFSGDCAEWIREVVQNTVHRLISPLGEGDLAFSDDLRTQIDKAFVGITTLASEICFQVKAGMSLTKRDLQVIFNLFCPFPPIC